MLIEVSSFIGGFFGTFIGKFLGRFRLWKVFVGTLVLMYGGAFVTGVVVVGFKMAIVRYGQLFAPLPVCVSLGLAACATFVAFLGKDAAKKAGQKKS